MFGAVDRFGKLALLEEVRRGAEEASRGLSGEGGRGDEVSSRKAIQAKTTKGTRSIPSLCQRNWKDACWRRKTYPSGATRRIHCLSGALARGKAMVSVCEVGYCGEAWSWTNSKSLVSVSFRRQIQTHPRREYVPFAVSIVGFHLHSRAVSPDTLTRISLTKATVIDISSLDVL